MTRISTLSVVVVLGVVCIIILLLGAEDCDECYSASTMMAKLFFCGLVIMGGSLYLTKKYKTYEKIIFDVETYPILETNEASDETPFSGYGVIRAEKTLSSQFMQKKCVYYHSILEQRIGNGDKKHWKTIKNKIEYVPFEIVDERGSLKVDLTNIDYDFSNYKMININPRTIHPKNSEVDATRLLYHSREVIDNKVYRKTEYVLEPDTKVFAYGYTSMRKGKLTLHEHMDHPLILSKKTQRAYVNEFYVGRSLVYYVHLFVFVGYLLSLLSLYYFWSFSVGTLFMYILFGAALMLGTVVFTMYNRIILLEQRAVNSLSNISVELKRRTSLIPNLVRVVREYAGYEKKVQEDIAQLRTRVILDDTIDQDEGASTPRILMLQEAYPELKASSNFSALMTELVDTEERIAYSREFYNRSVRKYNTLIQQFPFLFIASMFGRISKQYVNIKREERENVSV